MEKVVLIIAWVVIVIVSLCLLIPFVLTVLEKIDDKIRGR